MKQDFELLARHYAHALDLFGPSVLREWPRHERTARRYAAALPANARLLDVGSGGGLPGIVIAQARPDVHVTLCERRQRRASFLKLAVARLGLANAEVFAHDVRRYQGAVQWVSAQAVGELPLLVDLVKHAVADPWHLLSRRPRTWYAPQELMGFRIDPRREALDSEHDLVILTFTTGKEQA